jgi:hypothetical protein
MESGIRGLGSANHVRENEQDSPDRRAIWVAPGKDPMGARYLTERDATAAMTCAWSLLAMSGKLPQVTPSRMLR